MTTVAAVVKTLGEAPDTEAASSPVDPAGETGPLLVPCERQAELSSAQQRLWFLDQYQPGSALYNIPDALRLEGEVDAAALERAFSSLVRRHESLRTTFETREGGPVQIINPAAPCRLAVEDLRHLPSPEREAEALRLAREEARRPFDLSRGPLLRTRLLRLDEREYLLLVTLHHIISDGWSTAVLIREVACLYEAFCQGRPSPLPELPQQYAEFALWQREHLHGEVLERQLAWWKRQLEGAPPALELPTDWPRTPGTDSPGAVLKVELPVGLTRMLRGFCRAEGATLFMGLLAGFQLLLSRYSGQQDVSVGVPVAGRARPELEGLIGFFVNTLVLRTKLDGDPTFRELLGRVKQGALGAFTHQDVPFDRLVDALQPPRHAERTPFFQVALVLHNTPLAEVELPGLRLRQVEVHSGTSKFDFSLSLRETPEGLTGKLEYRSDLYAPATAARLVEHLVRLLEGALSAPDRRVSELPLLSGAERRRVLEELATSSETASSRHPSVLALIEAQAALAPQRPAVACEEQSLTYGELNARANQLAWHLRSLGVGPETCVALCLERSADMVMALLATWKAGGAYVPLDPEWPASRLERLVHAVAAPVVITLSRHAASLASTAARVVALDTEAELLSGLDGSASPGAVEPDHAAYVLFTSGSTGQPKGVVVAHAQLLSYVQAAMQRLDLGGCASFALVSTFVADLGNTVLFPALCTGGLLHVLTRERASNPAAAAGYLQRHPVDCMKLAPSHLAALLTAPEPRQVLPRKRLVLGGESLSPALLEQVRALAPDCQVFNHYGPTETTVGVLAGRVEPLPPGAATGRVPLGRPLAGTRVYVLDEGLRPVPVGVPGELYVGGAQVTRGYLGRPELTARWYMPDPYSPEPGARMYRTGDRVRWLRDGRVEFLGRTDFQVKVRGFRVEPAEVEAALRQHPAVREALVVAWEHVTGGKRLVAYVVPREPRQASLLTGEELRGHAIRHLPGYMVPASFTVLEALPLTPNGKVDREALPSPELTGAGGFVAPRTPLETQLAAVFAEVLRVPRVGVTDGFFELGGNSLLATQLVSRLRAALGVELPLRALFETPTVEDLAPRLEDLRRTRPARLEAPPLLAVERQDPLPLSFAQQRLWFLDQLQPLGTVYSVPVSLRLEGVLDLPALQHSFEEVVRRHESLRTTFRAEGGQPLQVIASPGPLELPLVDLTDFSFARREAEARRLAFEEAQRPFNLSTGPLLRVCLLRLGERQHMLLLNMHHIVSDGWSMGVLVREVVALYEAFRQGQPSPLPALPLQYADYAVWQRGWLRGEALRQQLGFWKHQLDGMAPVLELPTDTPRSAVQSEQGASLPVHLPRQLSGPLHALCQREGVTPFMALLAGFQLLLSRYSGQEDIPVGSSIAGRTRTELEGLIGFFANTLVLRTKVDGQSTFRRLLAQVRATTLAAYEHQDLPFEKLVEELHPQRSLSHTPLFQAVFVLQNPLVAALDAGPLRVEPVDIGVQTAKYDLMLSLTESPEGFSGSLGYRTGLFERATMARLARHLQTLLQAAVSAPEKRLGELPLMDPEERQRLLVGWNDTRAEREETTAHRLFQAQAAHSPEAPAVSFEGRGLTYAELERRSNQLAHHLRSLGARPETRVALCVERSPELVIGMLGILKAGAAYVPLDPSHPAERLGFMLRDCAAPLLVTTEALAGELPFAEGPPVLLDADAARIAAWPQTPPATDTTADNLAYVIYTSGSTGQPKGTLLQHRGLCNTALAAVKAHGFTPDSRVLQYAASSFDASVCEVFATLLAGACLVLAPRERLLPDAPLRTLLKDERITAVTLTPSVLAQLQDEGLSTLRTVISAGEALSTELARRWSQGRTLLNAYGPTEVTVCATITPGGADPEHLTIGRPWANTRVYVLDGAMQPVPVGLSGELYVGGVGLARGYLNRPGLTAERFMPDPFSAEPGARLYRTGDRVRWCADGTLEYLGRADHQVKLRGFRIELGEVEAVLEQVPGVRRAVVLARQEAPGDQRLVAWLVPASAASGLDAALVRSALKERLPEYMVPSAFVVLEALPLTPHGKVDLEALPAPDASTASPGDVAPRTALEARLAQVFAQLLRLPRVGVTDNFFELGGHSLLATQLVSRVHASFDVELPLRAFFEAPTVEAMALRIEAARRAGSMQPGPALVPMPREGALPLSFAQQRLWFLDQLEPGGSAYNIPLALVIEGELRAEALEHAFSDLLARHEPLRTTFASREGEPLQVIHPPFCFPLPVEDLGALPEAQREAAVRTRLLQEAGRPFNLETGPLLRANLLRLASGRHVLLLCMHHIVSDAWSMDVLVREMTALYAARVSGRAARLPELPVQYADYAQWQRAWLRGEALEAQLDYWKRQLAGVPVLELPTDKPRPAARSYQGASLPVVLPRPLSEALVALGQREGVTPFMLLLAGWQLLLSRYSGQDDVAVGAPIAGRQRAELEGLIGFFVNTLVLRAKLDGQSTFRQLLAQVRATTLAAYEAQSVPFEKLVEELHPQRSLSHSPLFQVLLALQNTPAQAPRMGEGEEGLPPLRLAPVETGLDTVKFDLTLSLTETPEGFTGRLGYRTDLFEPATVARMARHLLTLLQAAVHAPETRLDALPMMEPQERGEVLARWNDTRRELPWDGALHERFEVQAALTPEALAVLDDATQLSFSQLNRRANQLAHALRLQGAGPEARVGLCLERGVELVVAVLAILKSGAAYVPLDPAWPAERLVYMLQDCGARLVLTQRHLSGPLEGSGARALCLDDQVLGEALALQSEANPTRVSGPEHLAYVIYTSGSTGRPKGVMARHASVMNLRAALASTVHAGTQGPLRSTLNAPLAFDASVQQLVQLTDGHALCVVPQAAREDVALLKAWLEKHRVDVLDCSPSHLRLLLDEGLGASRPLRVLVGGEAVDETLWARLASHPHLRAFNMYGPTECTVDTTTREVRGARPTLGGPLANVRVYVLDGAMRPVPVGVPGELYVGGAGLARGYQGQPGLTAERFVPDPFSGAPGARLYRTGDKARWLAHGELEFLGRVDFQVKLRGFRIEPGEVEQALERHPALKQAVVLAREDAPGLPRLAAYVVPHEGQRVDAGALRAFLQRWLPDYMVPAVFVPLEALPLTPGGKLDRRALPAPDTAGAEGPLAPRTPTEERLAALFAELLGVERVGVHDDFFTLGGHSLLATRLLARVQRALGVELPLRVLFEEPTVAGLAHRLTQAPQGPQRPVPPLSRASRDEPVPLAFTQERMWKVVRSNPTSASLNLTSAWRMKGLLRVEAVQAALQALVDRHEALRTTFVEEEGRPVQKVAREFTFELPRVDLRGDEDAEARLLQCVALETDRPFDLARGPLLRGTLFQLADDEHLLFLCKHHIIVDGWSQGIITRELAALYTAFSQGQTPRLPPLQIQFADYAAWVRGWLRGPELESRLGYWRQALDGAPTQLELPTDKPRPPTRTFNGTTCPLTLGRERSDALQAFCQRERVTPFMALLALHGAVLCRQAGQEQVLVGSPIANRPLPELEPLVGLFINTLALRVDLRGNPSFRQLLSRVREMTLGAYAYQEVPFEYVVNALGVPLPPHRSPLFQTMFVLQTAPMGPARLPGLTSVPLEKPARGAALYELTLLLSEGADGFSGGLEFNTDLFEPATAERLCGALLALVDRMLAAPDSPALTDAASGWGALKP